MPAAHEFIYPARDADIWGLNEDGEERDPDEIAADLEFNQQALEDYMNQLPQVFIQQASLGSGTIDPAQLATGTAGTGKAPVSAGASAPAWTDIATQSELDTYSTAIYAILFGSDIQRGRISITDLNGTNTVFTATFGTAFSAVPRVVATVECGAGIDVFPTLHAVNTTSFAGRVFITNSTTATCFVHWHAVKA